MFCRVLAWSKSRDRGATAVEYGLIVFLIAAAIMGTVFALGGRLNQVFSDVLRQLNPPANGG